jgi:hypothetical protein
LTSDSGADAGADAEIDAGSDAEIDAGGDAEIDAGADSGSTPDAGGLSSATVLDLNDVSANPTPYGWFDFKSNVKKLILAGAPETEHVAILWYTTQDGGVGLHYHAKTESVYVIDGTQTDGKGIYPTGTVYFNPPGSGHQITDSTGFFLLAYAAPPDFMSTNLIGEYTPIRIDTVAADLTTAQPFESAEANGVRTFSPALDSTGGMTATFIDLAPSAAYLYRGTYLLALRGRCSIEGLALAPKGLVVGKTTAPQPYAITAPADGSCLAMGVSF